MALPSFPQRGQPNPPQLLEVPADAPKIIKDWIGEAKFTGEFVRWFGLMSEEFRILRSEMNQSMIQLLGQLDQHDLDAIALRVMSFRASEDVGTGRAAAIDAAGFFSDDSARILQREWDFTVVNDTRAHRANYQAAQFDGRLYAETDAGSTLLYESTGGAWKYKSGMYRSTLAGILTGLGTGDTYLQQEVTDYDHVLEWQGAAWSWGPGEIGSGFYYLSETAPNSAGGLAWQICDGSTVARLNADGTTTNVTLDNVGTAAYIKGGTASAAAAAASGRTSSDSAGTPSGTIGNDADAGIKVTLDILGTLVALNPHAHPFAGDAMAGHDHGPGTLEFRNLQKRLYYRR